MRCSYCGAPRRPAGGRCVACGGLARESRPAPRALRTVPAPLPTEDALVLQPGTPLRDRARGPATVLQTLDPGDVVQVLGRSGKYMRVRSGRGMDGYIDSVQLGPPGSLVVTQDVVQPLQDPEAAAASPADRRDDRADLPFGMVGLEGERIAYIGKFIYDPFNDRAFVVTSHRVIIGGGGAPMPRVVELRDVQSARMREGSNGMAVGERTIVLQMGHISGETYISGLRDPERAFGSLGGCLREIGSTAAETTA